MQPGAPNPTAGPQVPVMVAFLLHLRVGEALIAEVFIVCGRQSGEKPLRTRRRKEETDKSGVPCAGFFQRPACAKSWARETPGK